MAKVYQCDACGDVMKSPYEAKMKEFYIGCSFEFGHVLPSFNKKIVRIHLCDNCYRNLNRLAEVKKDVKNND